MAKINNLGGEKAMRSSDDLRMQNLRLQGKVEKSDPSREGIK